MDGWPVWLASASLRNRLGRIVPTGTWDADRRAYVSATLDVLLGGLGDPEREREFRMNVTLCRHRALTPAEHDALPTEWHDNPAMDIAGGPVEVLWYRGVPEASSTQPCRRPTKVPTPSGDPRLWLPGDCGECPPCRARESARATVACACQR